MALLDDFERADENPLSGSGNWPANADTGDGDLILSSNQVTCATIATSNMHWHETFGPHCEVFVTVATLPGGAKNVTLFLRLQNAGTATPSGYVAVFVSATPALLIYSRNDDGVGTTLGATEEFTWTAGDVMGLRMIGNKLQAYQNGVALGTGRTDSTYAAAGKIGLGGNDTTLRLDDFGGGTLASSLTTFLNNFDAARRRRR